MWPAENIMQSMRLAVLCRFSTPGIHVAVPRCMMVQNQSLCQIKVMTARELIKRFVSGQLRKVLTLPSNTVPKKQRHCCCDVSSELCCPGAKPQRWAPTRCSLWCKATSIMKVSFGLFSSQGFFPCL